MENAVMEQLKEKGFLDIQLHQIQLGLSEGLAVEHYAKPEFDWFQMEEIRKGLKAKLDVKCYANPEIPFEKMRQIRKGLQDGIDLMPYLENDSRISLLSSNLLVHNVNPCNAIIVSLPQSLNQG